MSAPTLIIPAPLAALKSVSVYTAVKVIAEPLAKNNVFLKLIVWVAPITSEGAAFKAVKVVPSKIAGTLAPSTSIILSVPLKLYRVNLSLLADTREVDKNVITPLFAGLLAKAGLMLTVEPPLLTVASAVTV